MRLKDQLVRLAQTYCAARKRSLSRISTLVFNDGKVLDRLVDDDKSDLTTSRFEHAVRWFSERWPESVPWPDDIERPVEA